MTADQFRFGMKLLQFVLKHFKTLENFDELNASVTFVTGRFYRTSEELTLRRKVFVLKIQLKFYPIVRSRCKYHWSGERKKSSRFINIYRSLNKSIKTAAYSDRLNPWGGLLKLVCTMLYILLSPQLLLRAIKPMLELQSDNHPALSRNIDTLNKKLCKEP